MNSKSFFKKRIKIKTIIIAILFTALIYVLFLLSQGHTVLLNNQIVKQKIENQLLSNYDIAVDKNDLEVSDILKYKDYAVMFYYTNEGYGVITFKSYYTTLYFCEDFLYQSNDVLYDYLYIYADGRFTERLLVLVGQYNDKDVNSIYYSLTDQTEIFDEIAFGYGNDYYYYFDIVPMNIHLDGFDNIIVTYD